jgi:hypothetical protein
LLEDEAIIPFLKVNVFFQECVSGNFKYSTFFIELGEILSSFGKMSPWNASSQQRKGGS